MSDEELRQKIREGMTSFAHAFNLPAAALLDNVDQYFQPYHGEFKNEKLPAKSLQE